MIFFKKKNLKNKILEFNMKRDFSFLKREFFSFWFCGSFNLLYVLKIGKWVFGYY